MRPKKKIKNDILKILAESGIDKETWSKILAKLVNYTDKVRTGNVGSEQLAWSKNEHGNAEF